MATEIGAVVAGIIGDVIGRETKEIVTEIVIVGIMIKNGISGGIAEMGIEVHLDPMIALQMRNMMITSKCMGENFKD